MLKANGRAWVDQTHIHGGHAAIHARARVASIAAKAKYDQESVPTVLQQLSC